MITFGQQKRKDSDSHTLNDRQSWNLLCLLRNRKGKSGYCRYSPAIAAAFFVLGVLAYFFVSPQAVYKFNDSLAPEPPRKEPTPAPVLPIASDAGSRVLVASWWQRSEASKKALRELLKEGTTSLEAGGLRDELESRRLAFVPADHSDTCSTVCASVKLPNATGADTTSECSARWFNSINHCAVLLAAFPAASGCKSDYYGNDLPAFGSSAAGASAGLVLVNSRPHDYVTQCDAQGDHSWRLCPCSTGIVPAAVVTDSLHARLARTLVRQVSVLRNQLQSGIRATGQMNEWFATHRPEDVIDDIESGRVTFLETELGQSCYEACEGVGQACQMLWFDLLNNCEALHSAFPVGVNYCSETFFGRDLPAFRPSDATVLVNLMPRVYAASCGGKHSLTRRLCGCGRRKSGLKSSSTFHTVYNVQPSRYFEWQVRYMHLWFKQANMPGKITRLLTAHATDELAATIPTHVAPSPSVPNDAGYTPYNKPSAIEHWIREANPKEDIVILIDPDCMFVSPMNIVVEEGAPVAQQAFYHFEIQSDDVAMQIARRYCKNCTFLDPIAVSQLWMNVLAA